MKNKKKVYIGLLILLLLIATGVVITLVVHHNRNSANVKTSSLRINSGVATPTTHVPGGSGTNTSSGINQSKGSPSTQTTAEGTPSAPLGNFVSDHRPNLSGSPAPNTETSACSTSAGATCRIEFTMGSETRSLPAQTTNGNGNTVWIGWTLQSIGLTQGTWKVTAIAANGNKTTSAQDANALIISP